MTLGAAHFAPSPAIFSTSDPAVAIIIGDDRVVGVSPGTARITATALGNPQQRDSITVQVITPRAATNWMIVEVCPNEEAQAFVASEPSTEGVPAIHEFHDCQRLIEGVEYRSLIGVFAHDNVRAFDRWEDFKNGRLAAVIVNFGGKRFQPYSSLGIVPGMNCLVLKADTIDSWRAVVVAAPGNTVAGGRITGYGTCSDSLSWARAIPEGTQLTVKTQKGVDLLGRPIAPPVARWDWDPVRRRNYIGVKCDAETWCEIGPEGFDVSTPLSMIDPTTRAIRPIIKGYYDQQFLADAAGQRPSTVFGTIRPGEHEKHAGQIDTTTSEWYHVAHMVFREEGTAPSADFVRYVRRFANKDVPSMLPNPHSDTSSYYLQPNQAASSLTDNYRGRLKARVLAPDAVVFRTHAHLEGVPPTVRWRWDIRDELTWVACPAEGCCEKVKLN